MGSIFRIIFALIFLVALMYFAVIGLSALFEWFNPSGGSGRVARITTGLVVGLGFTIAVIAFRRFRA